MINHSPLFVVFVFTVSGVVSLIMLKLFRSLYNSIQDPLRVFREGRDHYQKYRMTREVSTTLDYIEKIIINGQASEFRNGDTADIYGRDLDEWRDIFNTLVANNVGVNRPYYPLSDGRLSMSHKPVDKGNN